MRGTHPPSRAAKERKSDSMLPWSSVVRCVAIPTADRCLDQEENQVSGRPSAAEQKAMSHPFSCILRDCLRV